VATSPYRHVEITQKIGSDWTPPVGVIGASLYACDLLKLDGVELRDLCPYAEPAAEPAD
jgi:hypothetical protein